MIIYLLWWLVSIAAFIYLVVDIWRSPAVQNTKILWTIFSFFCGIIALAVWLLDGRKKAYGQV